MRKPFEGDYPITQRFGENPDIYARFGLQGHNGVDFGLPLSTPLVSPILGRVIQVRNDPSGYGNTVVIENEVLAVRLAHLTRFTVGETQQVQEGELVGYSGNTGFSTGPHLHLGIYTKPRQDNNGFSGYVDPLPYMEGEVADLEALKIQVAVDHQDIENAGKVITEMRDITLPQILRELDGFRGRLENMEKSNSIFSDATTHIMEDTEHLKESQSVLQTSIEDLIKKLSVPEDPSDKSFIVLIKALWNKIVKVVKK